MGAKPESFLCFFFFKVQMGTQEEPVVYLSGSDLDVVKPSNNMAPYSESDTTHHPARLKHLFA